MCVQSSADPSHVCDCYDRCKNAAHLHVPGEEVGPRVCSIGCALGELMQPPSVSDQVLAVLTVNCLDLPFYAISTAGTHRVSNTKQAATCTGPSQEACQGV